jgi:hypothetical protein
MPSEPGAPFVVFQRLPGVAGSSAPLWVLSILAAAFIGVTLGVFVAGVMCLCRTAAPAPDPAAVV